MCFILYDLYAMYELCFSVIVYIWIVTKPTGMSSVFCDGIYIIYVNCNCQLIY